MASIAVLGDPTELEQAVCEAADAVEAHFSIRADLDSLTWRVPSVVERMDDGTVKTDARSFFHAYADHLNLWVDSALRLATVAPRLRVLVGAARAWLVLARCELQEGKPDYDCGGRKQESASAALSILVTQLEDREIAERSADIRRAVDSVRSPAQLSNQPLVSDIPFARFISQTPLIRAAWPAPRVLLRDALAEIAAHRAAAQSGEPLQRLQDWREGLDALPASDDGYVRRADVAKLGVKTSTMQYWSERNGLPSRKDELMDVWVPRDELRKRLERLGERKRRRK